MSWRRSAFLVALFALMVACGPAGTVTLSETDVPASIPAQGEPVVTLEGVTPIMLLTPTSGVGPFPLYEWEAIPSAAYYARVVKAMDGSPYWSWMGDETSVYLGGGSVAPPEDSAGPILLRPMTWSVFAVSTEHTLVGSSTNQPIAP